MENALLTGRQHMAAAASADPSALSDASTESEGTYQLTITSLNNEEEVSHFPLCAVANGDAAGSSGSGGEAAATKELNRCVRSEVARLSERWGSLLQQAEMWQRKLDDTLPVRESVMSFHFA